MYSLHNLLRKLSVRSLFWKSEAKTYLAIKIARSKKKGLLMSNFCILRIKKLHGDGNIAGAISHHLRTRRTDNANPELMRKNWFYPNDGIGSDFMSLENRKKYQRQALSIFRKRLPEKIRKNAVKAVEFMMTVSPEVIKIPGFNPVKYMAECTKWARKKFGSENVFFVAYHRDETTPHVSLLLTPIDENGKLNARKFFGGREKMTALQDDFYREVGRPFGLERGVKGSKAKHQSIRKFYSEINGQEENLRNEAKAIANDIINKSAPKLEQIIRKYEKLSNMTPEEFSDYYKQKHSPRKNRNIGTGMEY